VPSEQRLAVDQLVLDHVGVAHEVVDRPPVLVAQLVQLQPLVFSAEQAGQAVLVEDVVVAVVGDMVLQQLEAIGVDGADVHGAEAVEELLAHRFSDAAGDAVLERLGGALGEGEGDDLAGFDALLDE
jgi:hypothetical protein